MQRSVGNRAVLSLLRAVAPPSVDAPTGADAAKTSAPAGGSLLVADGGVDPGPGQMRLGAFLDQVDVSVRTIVESELSWTIYRVAGCPWIDHWLDYYRQCSPEAVEAAIRRYAPAASVMSAKDYVGRIGERLIAGIRGWQATGQLPDPAAGLEPLPGMAGAVAAAAATPPVPATAPGTVVARSLAQDPVGGRSLEADTRSTMGRLLGRDLAMVRVHTGSKAQAFASAQSARAVTVGRDVAFAAGQYAPGTPVGDALLAHELAHVLQQTGSGAGGSRLEDPVLETEADLAALDTVTALHLPGGTYQTHTVEGRTRVAPQRCGNGDVRVPAQQPPRAYAEIVTELKHLKGRKQAVLDGKEPESRLPEIQKRIQEIGAELQRMGVRLETGEILDRLDADPSTDLMQVRGQIVRTPDGSAFRGQKLEFQAVLDYVPPGRLVQYGWRWKAKGGNTEYLTYVGRRGSADRFDLGSGFWEGQTDIDKSGGMEVIAHVYLGDEEKETLPLTTGVIEMRSTHPDSYKLKTTEKVAIRDAPVKIEFADWAPTPHEYWIDWDVDGKPVADNHMLVTQKFSTIGTRTVTAHVYRPGDTLLHSRGEHITDVSTTVVVQDPEQTAEQMLGQMTGQGAPPSTKQFESSLEASIQETERHVAEGGEQRDFWVERLKAQRKRLTKLREAVPDLSTSEALPSDAGQVQAGHTYSGPIKAVLILPSGGGPQPLHIYLRTWQEGAAWKARLIDMTSADVYTREGDGTTPLAAYQGAFSAWMDSHPYPRGAKVRYEFAPSGWSLNSTFKCRDTAWETVKAWVDGILKVGGVIVGGLLLLTPEPTGATKALGLLFITASVARSAVAIYENLQLGIDPLDGRNVVEGLSILTSLLGVSGSLMRQYGIRAVSPLVYRVGSWTVMTSLAGDIGTMVFVGQEALAQLRATQADPTADDAQKQGEWLRVAAQLFTSGAMFFVTNKDLIKQGIRPSDFVKLNPRAGAGAAKPLSTGSRLDLALELKKAGDVHTAGRVSTGKIPDSELLDRHAALPWLKTGATADVAEVGRRLSPAAMVSVQDGSVKNVRNALDALGDDALFNKLAAHFKSGALMDDLSAGFSKIEKTLAGHPDRIATMKRAAELEVAGSVAGFEDWVKQTAERLDSSRPPPAEHIRGTQELTGELDAMTALANELAGDPTKMVRFTPAPPRVPGVPRKRSFDITIETRAAGGAAVPERLVEVHTETRQITGSIDLHAGVAHAASKLPLQRPKPVKGGPRGAQTIPGTSLPAESKEAAVVVTKWPPATKAGKVYKPDGSWKMREKEGHIAKDLVRELNGTMLDDVGAQFLDRVTVIDGNGRKIFSVINEVDVASRDGSRHKWKLE